MSKSMKIKTKISKKCFIRNNIELGDNLNNKTT